MGSFLLLQLEVHALQFELCHVGKQYSLAQFPG
jgi:hypothetical protein